MQFFIAAYRPCDTNTPKSKTITRIQACKDRTFPHWRHRGRTETDSRLWECVNVRNVACPSYLHLPLAHDLVYDLVVVLVELGLVVALLVAQDAQALRALQLDFELLLESRHKRYRWNPCVGETTTNSDGPGEKRLNGTLTSFQLGSVVSRKTRVLALLTK